MNCNRISDNQYSVIYDFGASIYFKEEDYKNIINKISATQPSETKPVLLISHWDIDHYSILNSMDDKTIDDFFDCIIAPNYYTSLTATRLVERLGKGSKVALIERKEGKTSDLFKVYSGGKIDIWIGSKRKNMNKTGLAVNIYGKSGSMLCTGDHSYGQVWGYMLEAVNNKCSGKKVNMCVPHHGGNAGVIKTSKNAKACRAIVSTGKNCYGHPKENTRRYLTGTKHFSWIRTDYRKNDVKFKI